MFLVIKHVIVDSAADQSSPNKQHVVIKVKRCVSYFLLCPREASEVLRSSCLFVCMCLTVCMSIRLRISETTCPNITKFSLHVTVPTCGRGSVLL